MDISEAAKVALAVVGGAGVVTFWVNSIATSIDNVASAIRTGAERKVAAYDARSRMLADRHAKDEREAFYERQRAEQAVRAAGNRATGDLHPSASDLLGKLDAQGRR